MTETLINKLKSKGIDVTLAKRFKVPEKPPDPPFTPTNEMPAAVILAEAIKRGYCKGQSFSRRWKQTPEAKEFQILHYRAYRREWIREDRRQQKAKELT